MSIKIVHIYNICLVKTSQLVAAKTKLCMDQGSNIRLSSSLYLKCVQSIGYFDVMFLLLKKKVMPLCRRLVVCFVLHFKENVLTN